MEKIVQRIYVRINPQTKKVQISCTYIDGYQEMYVANYAASQGQLKKDFEDQQEE